MLLILTMNSSQETAYAWTDTSTPTILVNTVHMEAQGALIALMMTEQEDNFSTIVTFSLVCNAITPKITFSLEHSALFAP